MNKLLPADVSWVLKHLPRELELFLRANPKLVIAGGFIRAVIAGEEVSDIDCIVANREEAVSIAGALHASIKRDRGYHVTENAITITGLRYPVQFIHRWTYNTPQEAIDSFDFTIAMAAISHKNQVWESVCHPDFYPDLAAKRLTYCAPVRDEDAGGSMLRLIKFVSKGYHAPLPTISAVIARMVKGVPNDKIASIDGLNELDLSERLNSLLVEVDPSADRFSARHIR